MFEHIKISIRITVVLLVITCGLYPLAVWGIGQLATGALSDHLGRKWLIAAGMWIQAVGIALVVLGNHVAAVLVAPGVDPERLDVELVADRRPARPLRVGDLVEVLDGVWLGHW